MGSLATGYTLASVLAQALVIQEIFRPELGLGLVTQLVELLSSIWGALSLDLSRVKKGGTKEEGSQQVRPGPESGGACGRCLQAFKYLKA